jgi:hypothetical protein
VNGTDDPESWDPVTSLDLSTCGDAQVSRDVSGPVSPV